MSLSVPSFLSLSFSFSLDSSVHSIVPFLFVASQIHHVKERGTEPSPYVVASNLFCLSQAIFLSTNLLLSPLGTGTFQRMNSMHVHVHAHERLLPLSRRSPAIRRFDCRITRLHRICCGILFGIRVVVDGTHPGPERTGCRGRILIGGLFVTQKR